VTHTVRDYWAADYPHVADIWARTGISDAGPELKSHLKKMALCSLIALALFFPLFYFVRSPIVFVVYIISFLFSLKIAYLGANHGFLLVVLGTAMAGMLAFVPIILWLKLPGIFFLYLLGLIALLILRGKRQRLSRANEKIEELKERHIRAQARRDPGFTTFCYQCLFYRPDIQRCRLRLEGREVRDLSLNLRTYCTSFRRDAASVAGTEPATRG